ncbi:hypothetical protein ACWDE9_36995 [Streptomyces olivaceoviridis]
MPEALRRRPSLRTVRAASFSHPIELGRLLLGAGRADLQALDLADPARVPSFGDPIKQVVADPDQTDRH